jgi:hypothetical protein
MKRLLSMGIVIATAAGLSGCLVSKARLSDDFGAAAHQDTVAQIAEPAHSYAKPPPPSNGARAVLAQTRYRTGKTITPVATASEIGLGQEAAPPAVGGAGPGM